MRPKQLTTSRVDDKELGILYIEDDTSSRNVMEMLLRLGMGCSELTIFEDSSDFAERMRGLPYVPDIVFLDIQIQPHDGYQILKMLRADPQYRDAKVIAMTASVMSDDVSQLREAGFDGLIGKPIPGTMFPKLMEQILVGKPVWYVP
jgi:CheY-like chemotaxis protein